MYLSCSTCTWRRWYCHHFVKYYIPFDFPLTYLKTHNMIYFFLSVCVIKLHIFLLEKVPSLCSQRWILAYLFCSGYFFVYALRVNISVALVCMVKSPVTNFSTMSISGIANVTQDDQCGQLEVRSLKSNEVSIILF